ncbi:MAG: RnfABCDGE type electron transport complex subunit D, partial [Gammaproteobacteria bacterium]|nr:RnfABCDGE type electron transport complex subunit D [Gammaproteobacteria bacterium]
MTSVIVSSPYVSPSKSLRQLMITVVIGLIPGTAAYIWFFGFGVLVNIVLAISFALAFEALVLWLRKKPIKPHLTDFSAVVAAWIFALCLPMHSPWWLVLIGIGFAMIAGKHLYGGLGFNPFNPAMVGYVALLISFPQQMTLWYLPEAISGVSLSLADSIAYSFGFVDIQQWDALTSATPLDQYKTGLKQNLLAGEILQSPIFGNFGGTGWEWIAGGWLIGGIWLLVSRTIFWHIPVAVLAGLTIMASGFYLTDPQSIGSPLFHLLSGSIVIGAFFIATDPVTAATTNRGRIIYGLMIGMLVYIIRSWGGY